MKQVETSECKVQSAFEHYPKGKCAISNVNYYVTYKPTTQLMIPKPATHMERQTLASFHMTALIFSNCPHANLYML